MPPLQVVVGLLPVNPAGSALAATASPLNATELLGLLIVKVRVEVPDVVVEDGAKAAVMVGVAAGRLIVRT